MTAVSINGSEKYRYVYDNLSQLIPMLVLAAGQLQQYTFLLQQDNMCSHLRMDISIKGGWHRV
ncbi:MAG: hypothetical protein E7612_06810 [Ruminococcaceae bacterium]|nr:hypothetical protein [Oscillospiraceae bacterium]